MAADVRQLGMDRDPGPEVYIPWSQDRPFGRFTIAMRYRGQDTDVIAALRSTILHLDSRQPLGEIANMDTLMTRSRIERRFPLVLFSLFGAMALLIAAVGIYGVVSHSVAGRTQEMGVRFALGAERTAVRALVLRQALTPVVLGLASGLGATLLLTRYLKSLLFGVRPGDPTTLAMAAAVLLAVALIASLGPSLRACRVDPIDALREM